ncbi:MAG: hypothetical protein GDA45_02135 [Chromatiales bacterium]|nr:hypothetical protein [Chromatiales bacterium]
MTIDQFKSKKYLLFPTFRSDAGVDHIFTILSLIFAEAQHLDRVPVIGGFAMGYQHNLNKSVPLTRFENYLDLTNSVVSRSKENPCQPKINHLEWLKEEEFDACFFDKAYLLSDDEIVDEQINSRYDVVIRDNPSFKYVITFKRYCLGEVQITFSYSERINQLTDEVLAVLGISRQRAIAAQHYFFSKIDNPQLYGKQDPKTADAGIPLNKSYYACMHVRASIKDRDFAQRIFPFSSSAQQIQLVLANTLSKGAKLYIMSDIHQVAFFDFLKADYQIYRYHDFPALKRLVSGEDDNEIDNVMLYMVEKNIMRHATVKILPPHKGPMIYHLNTIYDVYNLKKPPVLKRLPAIKHNIIGTIKGIRKHLGE